MVWTYENVEWQNTECALTDCCMVTAKDRQKERRMTQMMSLNVYLSIIIQDFSWFMYYNDKTQIQKGVSIQLFYLCRFYKWF